MDYKTRKELNEMSKQAFGTSSKWQKLVNDGYPEPFEREREVMVPSSMGLVKKTFTDKKSVLKRYSVEEVRTLMFNIIESQKSHMVHAERPNSPLIAPGMSVQMNDGSTVTVMTTEETTA